MVIQKMSIGEKVKVEIPPSLAYAKDGL